MKNFQLINCLLFLFFAVQQGIAQKPIANSPEKPQVEYSGGNLKMVEDIKRKLENFTPYMDDKELIGEISFTVNKEGEVKDIEITNLPTNSLENKIKTAVGELNSWKPLKENTAIIESRITIPLVLNGHPLSVQKMDYVLTIPNILHESDKVFLVVQIPAQYKGGIQRFNTDFMSYMRKSDPRETSKTLRIILQFVVEKDGSLTDIKVAKSSGDALFDKEVVRVISKMKKWQPALTNNMIVRSTMNMPITIQL